MMMFLRALPLLWQIGIGVAIVGAVGGAITWNQIHQYNKGYNAAIAAIAEQDQEAVDAKDKAVARVRECRTAGGVWDAAGGVCDRR